ncbi:MAG: ribulose-phosphate 3-epimerase, partial [Actinomycetes bacterium]|nr:ribulose-phosphate 3-epimerase [Actinomycetes bacterium]
MAIVAPSILAADFTRLKEELAVIASSRATWLHLDVMDGHFVPNLSIGPPVIAALRPLTKLFFDVHLMVANPAETLDWYLDAGADLVCVHYESASDLDGIFTRIREAGVKSGLALCPDTPVELACPWLDVVDMVLIMGVHPGFAGQEFIARTPDKI